jgi:hypothetical protein
MLLISESGARKRGESFILDLWGEGDHFDYTHAQNICFGCIEF